MPRSALPFHPIRRLATALVVATALSCIGFTSTASAVSLNGEDLSFILEQIKRAEAHAAGGQLAGPGPNQVSSPMLPYGLRTVDGTFNNLTPGKENLGSADKVFPRLTDPLFLDADAFDPDGPAPGTAPSTPTSYKQTNGVVADSEPRIISNLIVDQTTDNPAAVAAADDNPGSETAADGTITLPNRAPDEGLSAPFNSWFTLFGQFFDHGLDLTTKGGSGTVLVPLKPDDELYVPGSHTNFMALTRATNQAGGDGMIGTADDVREHTNTTTPFVDQNQTYTSHPSHQVFLREYELNAAGKPVATGRMLDGADGDGLATWAGVKQQARAMLGIELDDQDVLDLPLIKTDPYGKFVPDPATGFPQIAVRANPTAPITFVSGTPASPRNATEGIRTKHAFLDDIAHHATPFGDHDNLPHTPRRPLSPDNPPAGVGPYEEDNNPATYDDELLDRHFITGDGRGNENIGLTSVHHVFHAEHNLRVDDIKALVQSGGGNLADWQLQPGRWNGERLFQAARFVTEMEYQHLVFEEFARKVQPQVDVFTGYNVEIDPAITAEFAHTVYRFGHSMLNEDVARQSADGTNRDTKLLDAFLNPVAFDDDGALTSGQAAGSIARGMTRQRGNEIDEFVTPALRSNLLGLPLDLATLNIARGRDTGVPPLNAARRDFHEATGGDAALRPYESWDDFRDGLRHPESLVNFVAAYGTHSTITGAGTVAAKRAAAELIVDGGAGAPADRLEFLASEGPDWESDAAGVTNTGLDDVDFWVGGVAERTMPFGGLLGSTFNFVFETQMEKLQDGDRMYYLSRTAGLNFLTQLEENSFSDLVRRTTDATHLPADVFSAPDYIFELGNLGTSGPVLDDPNTEYDESDLLTRPGGTIRFNGGEHILMGGTDNPDRMRAGDGDDTLYGDGGNDRIEGGAGNDSHIAGPGDDILTDLFGDDNLKAGPGNDAVNAGQGFDLILAGVGNDFVVGGSDPKETFSGTGDDYVIGGGSADIVFAGEGADWLEGGEQADLLQGDNGDPFQTGRFGDDVINGDGGNDDYDSEGGDDIMVSGSGTERFEGMIGFDWVTNKGSSQAADWDTRFNGLLPPDLDNIVDRFDSIEGLSGWHGNDTLRSGERIPAPEDDDGELTNPGLIDGLPALLGGATPVAGGNIVLGGEGNDLIEGRTGNDVIDGDRWLNVRISVRDADDPSVELDSADSMREIQADVLAGDINPGQLRIVREIETPAPGEGGLDTAEFSEGRANYSIVVDADGQVNVIHIGGTGSDGADTLHNVERLRFSDETVNVGTLPGNRNPTGTVDISSMDPTEDQQLSTTRAFEDLDGVDDATLRYRWQEEANAANGTWVTVADGTSFAPGDDEVDGRLRVVALFKDNEGVDERVISGTTAPVGNVNDAPSGRPVLSSVTPREGRSINAVTGFVADPDGLPHDGAFGYQWQERGGVSGFADIAGATSSSYMPTSAQVGKHLRVQLTYTDGHGTVERLDSTESEQVAAALNPGPPPPRTGSSNGPAGSPTAPGRRPTTPRRPRSRLAVTALRVRRAVGAASTALIEVRMTVPKGARVAQTRVFRLPRQGSQAEILGVPPAKPKLIATLYRNTTRAGRHRFRLRHRGLRRLKPGRYKVSVRVGESRTNLGPARSRTLRLPAKVRKASADLLTPTGGGAGTSP